MANKSTLFPNCNGQDLEASLAQVTDWVLAGDDKIADRERAYAINREFDRIQDVLMENRETWEQYRGIYWCRKYHSFSAVLQRLDDGLHTEYLGRMRREYQRAMQTWQLDKALFTSEEWKQIRSMINRSEGAASMLRAIPVTRILAPYIPESVRRAALDLANGLIGLKRKLQGR